METLRIGKPVGTCPGCGDRLALEDKREHGMDEHGSFIPSHVGNGRGPWGNCSGLGREPEDVR